MKKSSKTILLVLAGTLLTGCASSPERPKAQRLVYSPNGEPLNGGTLGRIACPEALGNWFTRLAAGGTTISRAAFMADAEAQFQRMDIDKNGALYSEELERFRAPYRVGLEPPKEAWGDFDKQKGGPRGKREESRRQAPQSAAIDPVLSADANNDFKVTPDEFRTQAASVFADLDKEKKGVLTRDEVAPLCLPEETRWR